MSTKPLVKFTSDDFVGTREGASRFLQQLRKAERPDALIKPLSPPDLLLLFGEADDEQRAELLTVCTQEQFDALVDLRCWSGYLPDMARLEETIWPLVETGIGGALRAMTRLNGELRTLLFKHHLTVYLRESLEDDPPEVVDTSELIGTPDGFYFIEIPDSERCPDIVPQMIKALLLRPFEEYQPELEAVRHELQSDLEESALRWRNARLADFGFDSYEESRSLLYPLDPDDVVRAAASALPRVISRDEDDIVETLPALYWTSFSGDVFLDRVFAALEELDEPALAARIATVPANLGAMTNRFLSARRCGFDSLDEVMRTTREARDLLSLGLYEVSGGDFVRAAKMLASLVPGRFVQAAMGVLVPLSNRAKEARQGTVASYLDNGYRQVCGFLDREIPMWPTLSEKIDFRNAPLVHEETQLKVISSREEIRMAQSWLEEVESLEEVWRTLSERGEPLFSLADQTTVATVLMGALANYFVSETFSPNGLDGADLDRFTTAFLEQDEDEAVLGALRLCAGQLGFKQPDDEDVASWPPIARAIRKLLVIGRDLLAANEATYH